MFRMEDEGVADKDLNDELNVVDMLTQSIILEKSLLQKNKPKEQLKMKIQEPVQNMNLGAVPYVEDRTLEACVKIRVLLEFRDEPEYRVLCIDGGGVKGVVEGVMLKYLHFCLQKHHTGEVDNQAEDLKKFAKSEYALITKLDETKDEKDGRGLKYDPSAEPEIYRMFDMIVGTSTGSIVASAISRLHSNPSQIIKKAYDMADKVFPKPSYWNLFGKLTDNIVSAGSLMFSSITKYSAEPIENYLKKELKDCTWDQLDSNDEEKNRKDPILGIVCTHLETSAIHIYDSRKYFDSQYVYIHDAVRASTAAPTYFPPKAIIDDKFGDNVRIKDPDQLKEQKFIDGGLSANCPANYAMSMLDTECPLSILLSIGCGDGDTSNQPIKQILDAAMNNEEKWNSFKASHPHEKNRLFRLTPSKQANIGSYNLADSDKVEEMQKSYEGSLNTKDEYENGIRQNNFIEYANYLFAKSLHITAASSTLINRKMRLYHNTMEIKSKYNNEVFEYDRVNKKDGTIFLATLKRENQYASLKPIVVEISHDIEKSRVYVKYNGIEIVGSPIQLKFSFHLDEDVV